MSTKAQYLVFWGVPMLLYGAVKIGWIPLPFVIWTAVVLVFGTILKHAYVPAAGLITFLIFMGTWEAMQHPNFFGVPQEQVAVATARPPAECGRGDFDTLEPEVGEPIDAEGPAELYFFVQEWRVYVPMRTGFPGPAFSSVPDTVVYVWDDRCPPSTIGPYPAEGNTLILAEWEDVTDPRLGWLVELPESPPAQK